MIQGHATPEHFARWESHAKTLDQYSLRYVIKDCHQAAAGMRGWNPPVRAITWTKPPPMGWSYAPQPHPPRRTASPPCRMTAHNHPPALPLD
jgi:hypothetical protein